MMAKITKGTDFKGAEMYDEGKLNSGKIVRTLDCHGVDMDFDADGNFQPDPSAIAASFRMQAGLNPRVKYPVKKIALSWPPEDFTRLSDKDIVAYAKEYMMKMGYVNTQYLITRHYEKDNPHVHIIVNMVNNQGKKISDSNEFIRNKEICREMTLSHGFTWGRQKHYSEARIPKDSRQRAYESARYEMAGAIAKAMADIHDIKELPIRLLRNGSGITAAVKCDSAGIPRGICFSKRVTDDNGESFTCKFTGSALGRQFTCSNLMRTLEIKEEFPRLRKQAIDLLKIYDTSKDAYRIPAKVEKECERLRTEIRHLYADEKRLESKYQGSIAKGTLAVMIAIAYGTPLTALVTTLSATLVSAIIHERYQHKQELRAEVRSSLNTLIRAFDAPSYDKYTPQWDGHTPHANDEYKEVPTTDGPVMDDVIGGMRIRLH